MEKEYPNQEFEQKLMTLIANAGAGRTRAVEAFRLASRRNYPEARQRLAECDEYLLVGHQIQTEFLFEAAADKPVTQASLLMIHAMDQIMDAMVIRDIAEEFILAMNELRKGERE